MDHTVNIKGLDLIEALALTRKKFRVMRTKAKKLLKNHNHNCITNMSLKSTLNTIDNRLHFLNTYSKSLTKGAMYTIEVNTFANLLAFPQMIHDEEIHNEETRSATATN